MENFKRSRGRPRKNKIPEPEPEIPEPEPEIPVPEPEIPEPEPEIPEPEPEIPEKAPEIPDSEEVIYLSGSKYEEAAPTPGPVPPNLNSVEIREKIVYVTAPTEDHVVDDKARRLNALTKIKRYRENFDAVRKMKFNENGSTDALESHLEDIRIMISSKTSLMLVKSAYTLGVKGVEVGTCAIGMKTYGLSDLLSKNAEIDAILKELQCEIGIGNLPAHTRLALATISTVFVLDSVNKRAEVLSAFKGEVVNESISNKYGDL